MKRSQKQAARSMLRRPFTRAAKRSAQPPPFHASFQVEKRLRFTATAAAAATAISCRNIGDSWLFASAANAGFQIMQAFKIKSIRVWAGPSSTLAPVTVALDWSGATAGTLGSDKLVSDTSIGATRVASIHCVPPKDSQLSQWQSATSGNQIFQITCPAGSVIDLSLSILINDVATAQAVQNAPVGLSVGSNYMRGFDGLATAASNFVPISYPQA